VKYNLIFFFALFILSASISCRSASENGEFHNKYISQNNPSIVNVSNWSSRFVIENNEGISSAMWTINGRDGEYERRSVFDAMPVRCIKKLPNEK